jgi:hypothetical protein
MRTVRPGDDGVEVQFSDLREVVREPGDAKNNGLQRTEVGGRCAAVAEQQRGGVDGADQRGGVGVGQRGEPG